MRRFMGLFVVLAAMLLVALPASAGKNKRQVIMAETEVATGTPVSVTVSNGDNIAGYLIVTTANETATADMVVTVSNSSTLGDVLVCTSASITTDTTTIILLGSLAVAAEGVTETCGFPLGQRVKFTFTTSGVGADFDVTADVEWLATTAVGGRADTFSVYDYSGWDATATATSCLSRHASEITPTIDSACNVVSAMSFIPPGNEFYVTDMTATAMGSLAGANAKCTLELDIGNATATGAADTVSTLGTLDIGDTTGVSAIGDSDAVVINTVIDEDDWFRVEIVQRAADCTDVRGIFVSVIGVMRRKA